MSWTSSFLGTSRAEDFADKAKRKGLRYEVNLDCSQWDNIPPNHPRVAFGDIFERIAVITIQVGKKENAYSERFSVTYSMDGHQGSTEYKKEQRFIDDMKVRAEYLQSLVD
ncbi:hypothetical protein J4423_02275 [Candidatus Pacearchaeota archaeon]|nr:hypothetical protein [Candidatus Pacearchaeota archaeon]